MRPNRLSTGSWLSAILVLALLLVPVLHATKSSNSKRTSTSSKAIPTSTPRTSSRPTATAKLAPKAVLFTCELNFATVSSKGPGLATTSAILVDASNGDVLYAKQAAAQRPIASLSKLVTAMVVLDAGVLLTNSQTITKADALHSSRSRLRPGTRMSLADLLRVSLMISDNRATRALARAVAGSIDSFAVLMNNKVASLGLTNTRFVEPTGLSSQNVSTAIEVAKIIVHAANYQTISKITSTRLAQVRILNTKRPTVFQMANTNDLITSHLRVLAGKTGYIQAASYCLATIVQNAKGERLTLVVLGAPGDKTRFRDARKLAEWGFARV